MAEIRPLQGADVPAVASLLRRELNPKESERRLSEFITRVMIDDPWSDPELPSLVAVEGGEVTGFIGVQPKRVRFDERTLRGVCVSHLTVAAGARGGAAGALLLRRTLTAGQDFTVSDTAIAGVAQMWQTFGGHLDHARSCDWMVVLRPVRWLRSMVADGLMHRPREHPVGAMPFDAARPRSPHWRFGDPEPDVHAEDVDAASVVRHLDEMARGFRLWVDYDQQSLEYLIEAVEAELGQLVLRMVWRGDRPLGWYAYLPNLGSVSRVLHFHAPPREAEPVLADLVSHAREGGTAVLVGRSEPQLTLVFQEHMPLLGFQRRPVIHSHDLELLTSAFTGTSLLTQLNSEWFTFAFE